MVLISKGFDKWFQLHVGTVLNGSDKVIKAINIIRIGKQCLQKLVLFVYRNMTQEIKIKLGELWAHEGLTFNNFQVFKFIREIPSEILPSLGFFR